MWLRRLVCFLFGHRFEHKQQGTMLLDVCVRCRKLRDVQQLRYTLRRKVTYGDVERRMAENPPKGYRFVSGNWKKRKAKFVSPSGHMKFVTF